MILRMNRIFHSTVPLFKEHRLKMKVIHSLRHHFYLVVVFLRSMISQFLMFARNPETLVRKNGCCVGTTT